MFHGVCVREMLKLVQFGNQTFKLKSKLALGTASNGQIDGWKAKECI